MFLFPVWDEAQPKPEMVNSAQTTKVREITKVAAEALQLRALQGPRRNMKPSTKDKIKGSFHEVKGTIKEEVGKVTKDRNLKAKGRAEKKAGKVQQRIGRAKEAVAKLKGKLKELKTG
ncbi:MAG: CsbD family protein [Candidatus Korobacteraceae bacterium]